MSHTPNKLIVKSTDVSPFINKCDDPHHSHITWGLHPDGTIYTNCNGAKTWVRMNKCHLTIARIKALHKLISSLEIGQ